jgi:hypothetical protein
MSLKSGRRQGAKSVANGLDAVLRKIEAWYQGLSRWLQDQFWDTP